MKKYIPTPVDTQSISLPKELDSLVEEMSKNVYEVWAQTRIAQGWTYGEERNDADKKHPCLVPYEELREEEKTYDRNTSVETIKLILKLGFKISKEWWLDKLLVFAKNAYTKAGFGHVVDKTQPLFLNDYMLNIMYKGILVR